MKETEHESKTQLRAFKDRTQTYVFYLKVPARNNQGSTHSRQWFENVHV